MNPAPSVIIFTVFSGLGFGLLAFLGFGYPNVSGMTLLFFFALAYAMAVGGLLASVFHLGNKMNAIYAFSQWRSSWLSREGIAAVTTLVIFGSVALGRVFLGIDMMVSGMLGAFFAIATIFTTSMIYTQLKTIARWNQPLVPVMFLLHAFGGGALLVGEAHLAGLLLVALGVVLLATWLIGDKRAANRGTVGDATGLSHLGEIRMLESGHTARNYVLDEMVYRICRKHAKKLRILSLITVSILPAALLLLTDPGHLSSLLALVLHVVGALVGRWLFFAEAEHVVGLYYGK